MRSLHLVGAENAVNYLKIELHARLWNMFVVRLTLKRTASGHNAPFQIYQSPNVAAMRWRTWCTPGMGVS